MRLESGQGWFDQYGFDLDSSTVTGVLNPGASEAFLRSAVALGATERSGNLMVAREAILMRASLDPGVEQDKQVNVGRTSLVAPPAKITP